MHVLLPKETIKENIMILCIFKYLGLLIIGPVNIQFSVKSSCLMHGVAVLFCNSALAEPHFFQYSQKKSAWNRLGAVELQY